MPEPSLFEALGADRVLRLIIERFVDRIFDDVMIGYLFRAADRQRVKDKEFEFAAQHLGAAVVYTGRPLAEAHRAHRITGGQFMRRLQILKDTLAEFQVPAHILEHFVNHTLAQQGHITSGALDQCDPAHSSRSGSVPS